VNKQCCPVKEFSLYHIVLGQHGIILQYRSRFHERTISLRFLGVILGVLRLEVSVYNGYITNQFQTTFAPGGRGEVKSFRRGDCE
jgi:hypothetical protein